MKPCTTQRLFCRMALIICSVAAAACEPSDSDSPLAGTSWSLISIEEGDEIYVPPASADTPTLVLTHEVVQDGIRRRLTGLGGCNLLAGSYRTAAPDTLRLGALASTRKACPSEVMELEIRFTRVMADVTRFALEGSILLMTSAEARVRFQGITVPE